MKKHFLFVYAIITLVIGGCTEDIDTSSRYVFKEETITGYLNKHEQYSEYARLISEVPVYLLACTPDERAVTLLRNTLEGEPI